MMQSLGHGQLKTSLSRHTSSVTRWPRLENTIPCRSRRTHASVATGAANVHSNTKIFQTDQGSWIVAPDSSLPIKGVVHFLGGAFAGAAPQLLYSLLLDMVASRGYTVVATPYAVTFKHDECAATVRQQLCASLKELQSSPSMAGLVPTDAPLLGLGHSMGAHLHLLIGSYNQAPTKSNILISYNNKQVSDAIPIPGLLGVLGPSVQAARSASPLPLPSTTEVLQTATSFLPPMLRDALDTGGRLSRAALAIDQLSSVAGEVGDGVTDFRPSPQECRRLVGSAYSVNRTLLVRFSEDSIDETPEVESILRPRLMGKGMQTLVLPGTHITPCGGELELPASYSSSNGFGVAEAVARIVKEQAQAEVRRLGDRVVGWMDTC